MDIIDEFGNMILSYKKKKQLLPMPLYKKIHSSEIIYAFKMHDIEKRDRQLKKDCRTYGWIYIYNGDISKAFNIKTKVFYNFLKKDLGAKYSRSNGHYFDTLEECETAINKIYDYIIYNRYVSL